MKSGLVLINLGTPEEAEPKAVGKYLKEFLMDPYVVDIPWIFRWILVNLIIVPRRSHTSAKLYQNIWTDEGSPLLINSEKLVAKFRKGHEEGPVELAMRYGNPSIEKALASLVEQGVDQIAIMPLYPHYALSSTETCLEKCREVLNRLGFKGEANYYEEFYDHPVYISTLVATIREILDAGKPDFLLYSYHGIPEHQVAATGTACAFSDQCCSNFREHSPKCYRAQCFETTRLCNEALGWPQEKTAVSFQSRLGSRPWLKPYTDQILADLVAKGVKKLAVACPAFTADCLETIEEISIRTSEDFKAAGGEEVILVPSLNDRDDWVTALHKLLGQMKTRPLSKALQTT